MAGLAKSLGAWWANVEDIRTEIKKGNYQKAFSACVSCTTGAGGAHSKAGGASNTGGAHSHM